MSIVFISSHTCFQCMHIVSCEQGANTDSYVNVMGSRIPANTKHLKNICTTSTQRLRHWSNIVQMLYK